MALGLNEVLTKQKIVGPRQDNERQSSQPSEFTGARTAIGKRLKPWESPEQVSPVDSSRQESIDCETFQVRAQRAVQRAHDVVSKNTLMIEEIHNRRQMDRGMGLNVPKQSPRPLEGLNHLHLELNEQDPVLRLWKRSFWERFSDILH